MLGILQERMGLKRSTTAAYANAYKHIGEKHKDAIRVNYARALTNLEKYDLAVKLYTDVEAASFSSGAGLALTLYKSNSQLLYLQVVVFNILCLAHCLH